MPTCPEPSHTVVRARAVFPLAGERTARGAAALDAPLQRVDDGVVVAGGGVILAAEPFKTYARRPGSLPRAAIRDLGEVALVPGLVNCHTHLEISHMAGRTRLGKGFPDWLKSLIALDRSAPPSAGADARAAVDTLALHGTAAVGDIASRAPGLVMAAAREAGVQARVFCEIIGNREERLAEATKTAGSDPGFSLAGHAFYTTPGSMFVRARSWCEAHSRPFSMHLAEHPDEDQCVREGRGALYDMVRDFLPDTWRAPGK